MSEARAAFLLMMISFGVSFFISSVFGFRTVWILPMALSLLSAYKIIMNILGKIK